MTYPLENLWTQRVCCPEGSRGQPRKIRLIHSSYLKEERVEMATGYERREEDFLDSLDNLGELGISHKVNNPPSGGLW